MHVAAWQIKDTKQLLAQQRQQQNGSQISTTRDSQQPTQTRGCTYGITTQQRELSFIGANNHRSSTCGVLGQSVLHTAVRGIISCSLSASTIVSALRMHMVTGQMMHQTQLSRQQGYWIYPAQLTPAVLCWEELNQTLLCYCMHGALSTKAHSEH